MASDTTDWPLLAGKVALVAGGSSGIGRAVVECFARHAATVEFVAGDGSGVEATVQELAAEELRATGGPRRLCDGRSGRARRVVGDIERRARCEIRSRQWRRR